MPSRQPALSMLPHRAHRRPVPTPWPTVVLSILLIAATEALVIVLLPRLASAVSTVSAALVPGGIELGRDTFLGIELRPLEITARPLDYWALLVWFLGSVGGLIVLPRLHRVGLAARFLLGYHLVILAASSAYILFAGRLGYDGLGFSELYLRTIVVVWLVLPVFIGAVTLLLPFTFLERAGMLAACAIYEAVVCIVRYAAFAVILDVVGSVVMPNLYLFFGPLLDFVLLVGAYAMFCVRLSNRLAVPGPQDRWTWL